MIYLFIRKQQCCNKFKQIQKYMRRKCYKSRILYVKLLLDALGKFANVLLQFHHNKFVCEFENSKQSDFIAISSSGGSFWKHQLRCMALLQGVLTGMKNFLLGMYHQASGGILEQSMETRKRVGMGLTYRPAGLCSLTGWYENPMSKSVPRPHCLF